MQVAGYVGGGGRISMPPDMSALRKFLLLVIFLSALINGDIGLFKAKVFNISTIKF